jgi:hypothetical protein
VPPKGTRNIAVAQHYVADLASLKRREIVDFSRIVAECYSQPFSETHNLQPIHDLSSGIFFALSAVGIVNC